MLLTDRIYHSMFEAILRGEFLPGHKFLTEQEAIERYRASRITVRRAFAMLEEAHVICRKRKVGSVINTAFAAAGGNLNCIAAVVPLKSHFVRSFLATLCSEAADRDIVTMLEPASTGAAQNESLIRLVLHGVRDIVIWGVDRGVDMSLCLRLRILGVNLTFFDQIAPGGIADYVCLDNAAAIAALLDKAAEKGVRNVFFHDPEKLDVDTTRERREFCRSECARRGWGFSENLPQLFPPRSAVVAVNDEAALCAADCNVPIFSIDGLESGQSREIISYRQPMRELAQACFYSLQRQRELGGQWRARQYRLKNEAPFA